MTGLPVGKRRITTDTQANTDNISLTNIANRKRRRPRHNHAHTRKELGRTHQYTHSGRTVHRLPVAALARLTHVVADLAAAIETTLTEWRRKARMAKYRVEKQAAAGKT